MTYRLEIICLIIAVVTTTILVVVSLDDDSSAKMITPVFEVDSRNYIHMRNNAQNKQFIKWLLNLYGGT